MKKIFLVALLGLSVFTINAQEKKALPTTTVRSIDGKPVPFNKTVDSGKVTIISFWATWCIPCKQEIKAIKKVLPDWQKEMPDLNYMTVSVDDARATAQVKTYSKTQGWTWPTYLDPNSDLKRSLNFTNVPFTIIVDQQGNIVHMHTGYEEGGEEELFEIAKKLVESK